MREKYFNEMKNTMVSNKTSKFIKSLQLKKYRLQEKKFIVEGAKSVNELINSDFTVTHIIATDKYLADLGPEHNIPRGIITETNADQLTKLSNLKLNDTVLAVAEFKDYLPSQGGEKRQLALDGLKDPGNMGTIIRIADWYGITEIVCSEDCVDFYNPKVIQATMGSFTRVKVIETDLEQFLSESKGISMGAFMHGEKVHTYDFPSNGTLVIGNESNGISKKIEQCIDHSITIPKYGEAESLNAGIATAIICDHWTAKLEN